MTMREFIKTNRAEIDKAIKKRLPDYRLNDQDRRDWIMNDESLYSWARSEGVRV